MMRITLAAYLGRKFFWSFLASVGICIALIFFVETIENLRRAASHDVGIVTVVTLTLFRIPTLSEQVLPFATLFAALATFLGLSRSLELVVVRSVGVSVWQFIGPSVLLAFVIGVLGTTVFNPLAADLRARHATLFAQSFTDRDLASLGATSDQQVWLRQEGVDGQSILHARVSDVRGENLRYVTAFVYDRSGHFVERVEADTARIEQGHWRLTDALVIEPGRAPQQHPSYLISTYLTPEQVREQIASADTVSFWNLPAHARIAERTGVSSIPYRLQYQSLLARPLLLCAMVLIAATVSLRLFRYGNVGQMILGGVVAGFVLYVLTKLASDLAIAGAISPAAAAWGPAAIALLWGTTLLLYQEDG
ncbi:LPS export ABC transporter permease LptG [Lutibaculum baratangense]|uniref:Permease n=1 Tax=Lutibaculum baratangense AMV1 TaxID=631454 RepID=V4RW12_9HYPH|nr:LPS export ABC transporter permease LptG [Lutibaculum baratangense]ESR27225.1 permease [Lutibaculum baratangense AMV1]